MTTTLATARRLPASELHLVVAAIEDPDGRFLGWTAVEAPCTYDEALSRWQQHTDGKRNARSIRARKLGRIREYAVRSLADPRFAPLVSRPYETARTRKNPERTGTQSAEVKAAMAWAHDHGYRGAVTERAARRWVDREYPGADRGRDAWVHVYDRSTLRRIKP